MLLKIMIANTCIILLTDTGRVDIILISPRKVAISAECMHRSFS